MRSSYQTPQSGIDRRMNRRPLTSMAGAARQRSIMNPSNQRSVHEFSKEMAFTESNNPGAQGQ